MLTNRGLYVIMAKIIIIIVHVIVIVRDLLRWQYQNNIEVHKEYGDVSYRDVLFYNEGEQ